MLDLFAGRWSFARVIDDRRDGTRTHVRGTASLAPDGAGLTWLEEGEMHRPDGAVLQVSRRHLWRQGAEGRIDVAFEDGRPFHSFGPTAAEAVHLCGADRYAVSYGFALPASWRAVWHVTGPAKDYVSDTELWRAGQPRPCVVPGGAA